MQEQINEKITNTTCDESRRKLLKKVYVAPAVIALGSMSFTTKANASWWGSSSSTDSGGSSLSSGRCGICGLFTCSC